MSIDFTKRREASGSQNAIILGVEVDKKYKPVAYWYRPGTSIVYQAGKEERIPASEVIHIYKQEFPEQVRGFSPFNACLIDLKQLDDFQIAELMAAKSSAVFSIFYEPNGMLPEGDFPHDGEEGEAVGTFVQALAPGQSSVVPKGYTVKSVSPTHPNNNFDAFVKSVLKKIGASLGISYNQLCKDYESVSFSSLRESSADSKAFFEATQEFLIENWKEIQYKLFIEALVLNSSILTPMQAKQALRHHNFISQKRAWYDPSRDILATKYALELGVKNPLQVIEESGLDPNEVLDGWALWKQLCEKKDLSFNDGNNSSNNLLDPIEDKSDEEQMQETGIKN